MTEAIISANPQAVWQWFSNFCAIPHPTFSEKALGDFIVQKAQEKGLSVQRDAIGNILIQKSGVLGLENRPRVAVQAHIDMVPQKGLQSTHDFAKDPIVTRIEDGWVWANDTTLGADNGIGAAMGLALVFSDDIPHPPIDLVLTVEEEVGMGGARALNPEWLSAPYLINLDSEDEGILFIGCAGGRDATFSLPFVTQESKGNVYRLQVSGLKGGHSGIDIHTGRANANLVLAKLLTTLHEEYDISLADIKGGSLRNVIPREASALFVSSHEIKIDALNSVLSRLVSDYAQTDPDIEVTLEKQEEEGVSACSSADTKKMLHLLQSIPNGVIQMSEDFPGVVETSISMGVLVLKDGKLFVRCLMRSLLETPKDVLSEKLMDLAKTQAVELELAADYPGWKPEPKSVLLEQCKALFTEYYGKTPTIEVMHAGLECGILKGHAPSMEMISFGPNIRAAHSPKERVEIASVEKCWQVFCALLKRL